jgi:hypothetical protein
MRNGLKRSRKGPRLEIGVKSPKPDAHHLYMREFLAPLLAREFLRQGYAAHPASTSEVNTHVSTIEPPVGGVVVSGHSSS